MPAGSPSTTDFACFQAPKRSRVVDATGKYVMPGGIDPHTHLDAEMGWGSKAEIISTDDFYRYFRKTFEHASLRAL